MTLLDELELKPVVNAAATLTRLGGSVMPAPVIDAMAEAAEAFVDLPEMHVAVGNRIAKLTNNEAAYVSSGAAAGILLSVATCIAGTDPDLINCFPYLKDVTKSEVIIHQSQRNGYDYAARLTGATVVEVDGTAESLRAAISERTACILWFAGAHFADHALSIEEVVDIGHSASVPVLVDAAAQIPAISNLWHFTRDVGADAAVFSGGKGLRGPQSSGLVLGKPWLIDGCRVHGSPNHSLGRPMKVGKEELAGMLAAVEWALAQDEEETIAGYEAMVQYWIDGLKDIPGIRVERGYPSEAGQPFGRAIIALEPGFRLTSEQMVNALWDGDPRIAVGFAGPDRQGIALNPQTVEPGEDEIILQRLREILAPAV
ncbi:MAG: aminotransferase class V-fold PLP-dependent enzyme [Thermomicrobiales bacterium]